MGKIGDGSGSGYGDGYGYGDGDTGALQSYWAALLDVSGEAGRVRQEGALLALWKSDAEGRPANGGRAACAFPGLIEEVPGPLVPCTAAALHATLRPEQWKGERLWIVAMSGEVAVTDDKIAATRREILCEVTGQGAP